MQRVFPKILAVLLLTGPFLPATLHAQRSKDPLTDQESDQVAEVRDQPNDRIKLYQKFIQERIDAINKIGPNPSGEDLKAQLRAKYEEFTHISDELQDNLDTFDDAHADIRKSLKDLVPASAKWADVLNEAAPDRSYDFSRKTALDCAQSTADDAKTIFESQKKYFAEHKDEANKNGNGPD
jgi:ABC-type transporter Mla subunit MlaD